MQAWVVTQFDEPLRALQRVERPMPRPGEGELRIEVRACGLNFADALMCRGRYQGNPAPGFTPGLEACGIVVEGDPAWLGRRVAAPTLLPAGGLAQHCLVRADCAHAVPKGMSDVEGAALTITYETAWFALFHRAQLQAGETVLVHAGAGGVGSAAIQLAKAAGCTVLATAGGAAKTGLCRELGADVAIDYTDGDLVTQVREATAGRGVDVVLDSVSGDVFDASMRVVAAEGRIVVIGFSGGRIASLPVNRVLLKNCSVIGMQVDHFRRHHAVLQVCHAALDGLHAQGHLRPLIGAEHAFEDAPRALEALERRETVGKVVVRVPS